MLNKFFGRVKIRIKLLLAFGSIIMLSVLLTVYAITSINKIIAYKNLNEELDKLTINIEHIEISAKEFITEGYKEVSFQETENSDIVSSFNSHTALANGNLLNITNSNLLADEAMKDVAKSILESNTIRATFDETKKLLRQRGFKDFGLEGSLRKAIHDIEKSSFTYDKVMMLTLRRHEKDFFLRKDLKYKTEFNATAEAFKQALEINSSTDLLVLLENYRREFNQVVAIDQEIGLSNAEGKKGKLYLELNDIRNKISTFQQSVREINETQITRSKLSLVAIFFFQLVGAIVLAIMYSNVITAVIKEIREAMRKLAIGEFPQPLVVRTTEEIGQTKIAINQFLERLQAATSFAEKLGAGELTATYDKRYNNDVLAKAIINMQHQLNESERIQSKINWNNEGAARFSEILKNEAEQIDILGDRILKLLVEYLGANQAALYVINKEEKCFNRISTYAYGKKKFYDEKVDLETGLIGQCAIEKETIYLKEIPVDYVKITSGLGEATANNVLIVPLKIRGEVNGVLELAAFDEFKDYQIEFIEKTAENVASILQNRQVAMQTKRLLDESENRANALAQQEEEMRQNAEELQATQEEMERQRKELQLEIADLKSKLKLDYANS